MARRQRLLNVLEGRPIDRLSWTTLVDDETRSVMPEAVRRLPVLDFLRHVGCDILQFGNYGLPGEMQVVSPARPESPAEDVILLGALFPGQVFQKPGVTAEEIHCGLDRLYAPRLRRARLVLSLGADGLPMLLERFLAVRQWMEWDGEAIACRSSTKCLEGTG